MTRERSEIHRWRRIALPASIVLNLFLLALVGGHLWRGHVAETHATTPFARAFAGAPAVLPPQDAAAFSAVMRRDAPHYAEPLRQLNEARVALEQQVTAEHVDPDGLRLALATWRMAAGRFMDSFSGTLLDALAQVSADGRRKLVGERRLERGEAATP